MNRKQILTKAFFYELDKLYKTGKLVKVRGKYYVPLSSSTLAKKYHASVHEIADVKNEAIELGMIEKTFVMHDAQYIQLIKYRDEYEEKLRSEK